jgi:hypothetical protein
MINIHCPDCKQFHVQIKNKITFFFLPLLVSLFLSMLKFMTKKLQKRKRNHCVAVQQYRQFTSLFSLLPHEGTLQQVQRGLGPFQGPDVTVQRDLRSLFSEPFYKVEGLKLCKGAKFGYRCHENLLRIATMIWLEISVPRRMRYNTKDA